MTNDAFQMESLPDAREDDFVLVRAASNGDQKAFEQLYRKHSKRLFSVLWRLCGGQQARAEDCLQEAFVKAWQALPGFRYESAFSTWLHRLAVNIALMELRSRKGAEDLEQDDSILAFEKTTDTANQQTRLQMDLEKAVASLPERARAVLVLFDIEGWSHEAIAEHCEMAVGSSKAQLHRARSLLREKLGAYRE
ncbi:MAG: sigma-70 family RNA polymerase sigma factor [Arenimonas sp.]